jgi:hypothetical protein
LASSLGGVSQPLQLLAQRSLGARQQDGSRHFATALREPPRVGIVRQLEVQKLVAERQHGGAGGKSGRDDEIVVPELDTPQRCGGDPRGDLENELVDTKTVCNEVRQVLAAKIVVLQAALLQRGESGMLVARQGR